MSLHVLSHPWDVQEFADRISVRLSHRDLDARTLAILSDEHGRRLEVPAFVDALIDAALDQTTDNDVGRARYAIAITVCERCRAAVQEGGTLKQLSPSPERGLKVKHDWPKK